MEGVFERLVGVVKRALRKALHTPHLHTDQLATLLVEIESSVNSRPLLYVSSDSQSHTLCP